MAAITIDSPRWREGWGETRREGWGEPRTAPPAAPAERPALRVVGSGTRRPSPALARRRRLALLVVALLLVGTALAAAAIVLTRPARAGSVPEGRQTYVVEPGDTYWSIAARLDHDGDLRVAVDALIDANGGRPLFPGDRLELP